MVNNAAGTTYNAILRKMYFSDGKDMRQPATVFRTGLKPAPSDAARHTLNCHRLIG